MDDDDRLFDSGERGYIHVCTVLGHGCHNNHGGQSEPREYDTGHPVHVYERIGLLEESFGEDDGGERFESLFSNILDTLPQIIGPELSNIENDRQQFRRSTSSGVPRRQRTAERELDKLAWTWSTVRIA